MKLRLLIIFLLVSQVLRAQSQPTPYVILVSFDGFRYDYVEKYDLPNFKRFIKNGAAAESLIPSFPSKTFPNHYTLVTGLYPGNHGLVDNSFYDPIQKKQYGMKDRSMVEDSSFYGGIPLWQLAQQQGLKSASFFWVGSEVKIQGKFPDYYFKYDGSISNEARIDQTIRWLQLPSPERPLFISLYFSLVDSQGHSTGPDSPELKYTVQKADSLLGKLMADVKKTQLPVNIIIVSDHGMLGLKREEGVFINLSTLLNIADSSVVFANGGTQVHLYTKRIDSLYNVLKPQEKNFKIYKKEMLPENWHYRHVRVGDILLVADSGYYVTLTRNVVDPAGGGWFGVHGYDPNTVKEMSGIFYAMGPNINKGVTLKRFENIHVYPLVAKILGLKTPPIDGDIKVLKPVYKK